MRAVALLAATCASAIAIATLELTRLPEGASAVRVLAAFSHLLASAVRTFAAPAALLAAAALVWGLRERETVSRRGADVALAGLGVAQAALAREVLIEYSPFSWHLGANALFVGLGLGLAALHVALPRAPEHPKRARVVGVVLALAALAVARAHYAVLVGLYPTLHQCLLHLAFVSLALGGALAWPRLPRRAVVAGLAGLLAFALLDIPASAWARPVVTAYTELGRADGVARALAEHGDDLLPTRVAERDIDPDPDAEARFAAHSGLPALASIEPYDVLVVLSDATRHDATSLAGADTTPSLAGLARTSQVFERAYSPSVGTFPTVTSMLAMTPLSWAPVDLRRPRFWRGALRDSRPTAPEAMREGGRSTFWVGHDLEGSFSEHAEGLERGWDERVLVPEQRGEPADADVDRRIADHAIEAITQQRSRWLGWVFFVSPHDDYRTHDEAAPHATERERYDQELRAMDAQLARVLDAVDLERTVVVFAGDHGEAFGEHGHAHHLSSVYEEQIHVPLVVHVPGMEPARHAAPTSLTYVLPWLLLQDSEPARRAAQQALREDLGPWLRALDGAVVSELIGPRRQAAALVTPEQTVVYDVLADLPRLYDASDTAQRHDLRESAPSRFARALSRVRAYRRLRFSGRRFRFVEEP